VPELAPKVRFSRLTTHVVLIALLFRSRLAFWCAQNFVVSYFCALSCCLVRHFVSFGQHDGPISCRF
jgi:hypothetical protein